MKDELGGSLGLGLGHGGVVEGAHDVVLRPGVALLSPLADLEAERVVTEPQVFCGDEAGEEHVDTLAHGEGHGDNTVGSRGSVEAADVVREVVQNGKVVLHDKDVTAG